MHNLCPKTPNFRANWSILGNVKYSYGNECNVKMYHFAENLHNKGRISKIIQKNGEMAEIYKILFGNAKLVRKLQVIEHLSEKYKLLKGTNYNI